MPDLVDEDPIVFLQACLLVEWLFAAPSQYFLLHLVKMWKNTSRIISASGMDDGISMLETKGRYFEED